MKRKGYLYENIYDFKNIKSAFDEVCRNTKNKKKVEFFKEYECIYISRIYNILKEEKYVVGPYNIFTIREYLYKTGFISLNSLVSSRLCYKHLCDGKLKF